MIIYPKINSVFKRDQKGKIIEGDYAQEEFSYLECNVWIGTEKIDGTNTRVIWDGQKVTFGGRENNSQMQVNLLNKLVEIFSPNLFLKENLPPLILFGEGYGKGIQKKGEEYSDSPQFILFDVYINGLWLKYIDVADIAAKLNISVVPIVFYGTLRDAIYKCKKGFQSVWNTEPEGLILKPTCDFLDRRGNRIITKIKLKDFQ